MIYSACVILSHGGLRLHWQRDGKTKCGRTNRLVTPMFDGDLPDRQAAWAWCEKHVFVRCKVCERGMSGRPKRRRRRTEPA